MEVEEKGKISFLDCELHRKEDGRLDVTVHRKATHTDRYLHFDSHHPSLEEESSKVYTTGQEELPQVTIICREKQKGLLQ